MHTFKQLVAEIPHPLTNHEREELVQEVAQLLDKALGRGKPVVKDGNLQPIYELIAHYQRTMEAVEEAAAYVRQAGLTN